MATQYHTIVMHRSFALHAAAAVFLLRRFGNERYPGIEKAGFIFWDQYGSPGDRTSEEYEADGFILVDVGGGVFDTRNAMRQLKMEAPLQLCVAEALGISDKDAVQEFLERTKTKSSHPLGIDRLLSARQTSRGPEEALRITLDDLSCAYGEIEHLFEKTREAFEANSSSEVFRDAQGNEYKLIVISSDDPFAVKYARSQSREKDTLVVQKMSTGHVTVVSSGPALTELAKILRVEELLARGGKWDPSPADLNTLYNTGRIPYSPAWHLGDTRRLLTNGSPNDRSYSPTELSFERIKDCLKIAMNYGRFEPSRSHYCRGGTCLHVGSNNPCPWYGWGLLRCAGVRDAKRLNALQGRRDRSSIGWNQKNIRRIRKK